MSKDILYIERLVAGFLMRGLIWQGLRATHMANHVESLTCLCLSE